MIANVFAPGGYLSKMPRYEYRPQQEELARAIDQNTGHLMGEAPTGTGKTLAYLVPIIDRAHREGVPAVVATGTIALQEQLARDAQLLRGLYPGTQVAVLKGRANYGCPLKLQAAINSIPSRRKRTPKQEERLQHLESINRLFNRGLTERSDMLNHLLYLWPQVNAADCLKPGCIDCPLRNAREKAHKATVVITSHALLLTDAESRVILPNYRDLVVDESHKLEDTATETLSFTMEYDLVPGVFDHVRELGLMTTLGYQIVSILTQASRFAHEDDPVLHIDQRWQALCQEYQPVAQRLISLYQQVERMDRNDVEFRVTQNKVIFALSQLIVRLDRFFSMDQGWLRWLTDNTLHCAPLTVGPWLRTNLWSRCRAALLSATLQKMGEFPREALGLSPGTDIVLDSPFDYRRQCLLAIPDVPFPDEPGHIEAVADVVKSLFLTFGGAVMALFTSYASMRATAELLRKKSIPILVQGQDGERSQLIEQFKQGRTALLGTSTLWEGIDLVGDALQGLVIARLPFDVPTDPLNKARAALTRDPFVEYTLGRTDLRLRQGFGRLIRSTQDRGVVAIMDSRIRTKGYGKMLLRRLPDCTRYEGTGGDFSKAAADWLAA